MTSTSLINPMHDPSKNVTIEIRGATSSKSSSRTSGRENKKVLTTDEMALCNIYLSLNVEILTINEVEETFTARGTLEFEIYNFGDDKTKLDYHSFKHYTPFQIDGNMFENAIECECDLEDCEFEREEDWIYGSIEFKATFEGKNLHHLENIYRSNFFDFISNFLTSYSCLSLSIYIKNL